MILCQLWFWLHRPHLYQCRLAPSDCKASLFSLFIVYPQFNLNSKSQNRFTTCVKDIHPIRGLCLQPFLKHLTFTCGFCSWSLYCYYLCLWYCVVIFIWICILFLHSMLKSMLFSPLVFTCFGTYMLFERNIEICTSLR